MRRYFEFVISGIRH